jgi:uncharacterized RDD family membrane protein YckC
MSNAADQRFAPPQAHVADLAPEQTELAGRGRRFVAAVVDAVVAFVAAFAVLLIPALRPLAEAQQTSMSLTSWMPVSAVVGVLVFLVVQGWLLATRGQTVGKVLLRLRIVRTDGSRPQAWRLLGLRYGVGLLMNLNPLISMIYGLIDSLLIFRESRKCLHDSIADTQVIKL